MAELAKQKKGMFSKLATREDAVKAARDCAYGFIAVAAIQALLGAFIAPGLLFDAAIMAVLAFILLKWHSRTTAVLLLLMSLLALGVTVSNRLGVTAQGGNNIFLAVLMVVVSIRAIQATFALHGRLAHPRAPVPQMAARA
jgi:hypothetical protein